MRDEAGHERAVGGIHDIDRRAGFERERSDLREHLGLAGRRRDLNTDRA